MPRKNIDWLSIQRDWLAGATHAELAIKYNVSLAGVQSRSRRHKWRDSTAEASSQAATKIRQVVHHAAMQSLESKVKARSERYIDRITEDILDKTDKLISAGEKYPEHTYDTLLAHEQVREKLVSSGRKMFGLEQENHQVNIVIGVQSLGQVDQPAIEAQSEVIEPEPGVS